MSQPPAPPTDLRRIEIGTPEFHRDAYALYREMNAECPAHRVIVANVESPQDPGQPIPPAVLLTGYDAANAVMLDNARFTVDIRKIMPPEALAQMPPTPEEFKPFERNILNLDPPEHTRLRKLVQKSFTAGEMEKLRPRIRRIADELLDAAIAEADARGETAPDRRMELISQFSYPLPVIVIADLLGVPERDRDDIRRWSEDLFSSQRATPERQDELAGDIRAFIAYLRELFEEKRRNPGDDLVTEMVLADDAGDRLDEDELVAMVFTLLVAGHITTVNLIANGVFALLTHPEQMAKLKADPSLVKNAVEECLRWIGPAETTFPRFATVPVDLGDGFVIQPGEGAISVLAAADRDPARFANPDAFDIAREDAHRHMAFGKGVHTCLGAPLARIETQEALLALLEKMPDLALAVPADEITWQASFIRGVQALPVRF